jgi:hypothetical protein
VSEEDRSEDRVIRAESQEADRPMVVDPHDDRTQEFEFERVGMSRMRMEWRPEDADALAGLNAVVEREMLQHFAGAFQVMNEIYDIVREPQVNPVTAEILTDEHGWPLWARTSVGAYVEDYTKLGHKDVEHFLFKITTQLFEWELAAAQFRSNQQFAKALWEFSTAKGYRDARDQGAKTVEDRTQAARLAAWDDRLFGIFQTAMDWKAQSIVRSMNLLGQRLKDVLSA